MVLKQGTQLQNGKYQIVSILAQDDTVINYKATCKMTNNGSLGNVETAVNVILKEFFLRGYCHRGIDGQVVSNDQKISKFVDSSKMNFKEMAQNLASLNKANGTAQITDLFEENNTIYYVTPISSEMLINQRDLTDDDSVHAVPHNVKPRSLSTPPEPAEIGYGYESDDGNKKKKRIAIIASIIAVLIAVGAATYVLMPLGNDRVAHAQESIESTAELNNDDVIGNEARDRVAKDVAEINKSLPSELNDHISMVSAIYDKDQNVLTITYEVTNSSDLKEQKDNIRTGMLNGLKSNDNTGKHFREALITVKECFRMNGTTIDQFVLTPEDYSKIKI